MTFCVSKVTRGDLYSFLNWSRISKCLKNCFLGVGFLKLGIIFFQFAAPFCTRASERNCSGQEFLLMCATSKTNQWTAFLEKGEVTLPNNFFYSLFSNSPVPVCPALPGMGLSALFPSQSGGVKRIFLNDFQNRQISPSASPSSGIPTPLALPNHHCLTLDRVKHCFYVVDAASSQNILMSHH